MITTRLMTVVLILGNIQETTQGPCLSSSCSPEDDLTTCLSGDWQCNFNEFCEIVINDKISLNCKHTEPELQHCQERSDSNSDTCDIPTLPSEYPCHYCCEDDQCVRILSESMVLITENPVTAPHSCYSSSCLHGDSLNTCSSGQWACQDDEFCQFKVHGSVDMGCKAMNELQHCQTENAKNHEACDPAVIPSAHACHYCCENDLCVQDLTSSNQGLLPSATTFITALPTTLPTSGIQCVQCGDYDLNVPCTTMELLLDSSTECTVPGQNFCMTDVATDNDGVVTYIKRCVNRDTCHTLWYLESSDQNVCRNFDESTPDVSCHFCCVEGGCNINILPAENTLYNGHR